jgi:hypothetical protein
MRNTSGLTKNPIVVAKGKVIATTIVRSLFTDHNPGTGKTSYHRLPVGTVVDILEVRDAGPRDTFFYFVRYSHNGHLYEGLIGDVGQPSVGSLELYRPTAVIA